MNTLVCVGIDVSQSQLDMAVRSGACFSVTNDEPGWTTGVAQLRRLAPVRIVLEATGGLEVPLAGALATRRPPGRRGESTTGPGFCAGDRPVG